MVHAGAPDLSAPAQPAAPARRLRRAAGLAHRPAGAAGRLPDHRAGRHLAPGQLPVGQAAEHPGRRRLRLGLLVGGPPAHPPVQPVGHQLPGRAGRVESRLPHPDAAARRADDPGHPGVRPQCQLQPAVHPVPRRALLPDVPGRPALAATQFGAIAAGAFFGISPVLAWRSWYELNLALGALFLPLALEAAVRLRRGGRAARPWRWARCSVRRCSPIRNRPCWPPSWPAWCCCRCPPEGRGRNPPIGAPRRADMGRARWRRWPRSPRRPWPARRSW